MPRYEFAEGSSNKFWEIVLAGKSFTTTYGKIGTAGQTSLKEYGSPAEAKKEHDKLVAEKVKKGYALAAGTAAAKPAAAVKPAAKSGSATQPRYFELSDDTSNKFWEILQEGNAVKTRYGKIGTTGQQTLKEFGYGAAAKKEYDKLVAEKTKKGYAETAQD